VENKITVCGVEIGEFSKSVVEKPFRGDTVFILGNEVIIKKHKKNID